MVGLHEAMTVSRSESKPVSWAAASSRERRMRRACSLFWSWLFSFWQEATTPVGRWVMRTAESVVLTDWPPGPEER